MLRRTSLTLAFALVGLVAAPAVALDASPDEEPSPLPIFDPDLMDHEAGDAVAPGADGVVEGVVWTGESASATAEADEAEEGKDERRRRTRRGRR